MSTLALDTLFDYPAGPYPVAGRCHLRVFEQGGGEAVLVVTDLGAENPGASVTNAIEVIVTAAGRRLGLDPARLTVVEHSDDRHHVDAGGARRPRTAAELEALVGRDAGESFDVVTFAHAPAVAAGRPAQRGPADGLAPPPLADADPLGGAEFSGPSWRRITKRQAEALVGQPLP